MKYRIVSDSSSNVFHMEDIDYRTVPLKVIMNEGEFFDDETHECRAFLIRTQTYEGEKHPLHVQMPMSGQVHLMVPIRFCGNSYRWIIRLLFCSDAG